MPRKRFTPEEIRKILCHAAELPGQGKQVAEVVQALGVSEATFARWRQAFGGLTPAQAKRLQELERQNRQLRQLVADLAFDKLTLEETPRGNC